MADLAITTSEVKAGPGATVRAATAGENLTPGEPVYMDRGANTLKKADADTIHEAEAIGICLSTTTSGDTAYYILDGEVILGATANPAVGTIYVVSTTAGGIAPESDLGTGDYVTILGVGTTSDGLKLGILASGVAHA
jgi:hypothetical protein